MADPPLFKRLEPALLRGRQLQRDGAAPRAAGAGARLPAPRASDVRSGAGGVRALAAVGSAGRRTARARARIDRAIEPFDTAGLLDRGRRDWYPVLACGPPGVGGEAGRHAGGDRPSSRAQRHGAASRLRQSSEPRGVVMSEREVLANQVRILRNQDRLLANQGKLDRVLENQRKEDHPQPAEARSGAPQPEADRSEPGEDPRQPGEDPVAVARARKAGSPSRLTRQRRLSLATHKVAPHERPRRSRAAAAMAATLADAISSVFIGRFEKVPNPQSGFRNTRSAG